MRYLRNVTSLDRAAPGEREPPHSDAKIFEISAVEIAALKHRIGTPATIPPARTACIDSFAHACDFFPSADCDAACPRGHCGPTSRDKAETKM
jgi:hypothetical protein